jgi:hypothetical protein
VAFIAGTEPKDSCDQPLGDHRGIFSRIFGTAPAPTPPVIGASNNTARPQVAATAPNASASPPAPESQEKKKGFFGKIAGIFKGDDKQSSPPPKKEDGNNPH